ncbi:MAG: putative colanic acid biosynthesis glycosyl transferase [Deltaproteobacteria bacterium]|nr:putative colanic acid biosynthesis glycosyl transferase [Deltaproteobacteria bacterium]
MKIRILHQFFQPDLSATSRVVSRIAVYLANRGDDVSVICSRNRYDPGQSDPLPVRERKGGLEVLRCWGPSLSRQTITGRGMNALSFCFLASLRALCAPRVDVVLFMTDPPFFPALGALLKRIRKEKFVYILMDVYPDVAIRAGILRGNSAVTHFLHWFSRIALKGADRIVVLGEDMKEAAIRNGARPEAVLVIRNWAEPDTIQPVLPEANTFLRALRLDGKFVVEYSGNLGISHDFDDLLAVAESLSHDKGIRFLVIGDGARRREVDSFIEKKGLANLILLPYQEAAQLSQTLSAGDVHFISLRKGFEGLVVPSKAYGVMAAARPIIYQGEESGEIARMVKREGIGIVIPPGDREGLRRAILLLREDRKLRTVMGEAARSALEKRYSSNLSLEKYGQALKELAGG